MSRRGSDLKLSFFAFQDIITAVTGIMLLIVLMLALELNPESAEPADPVAEQPAAPLIDDDLLADVRRGRETELQAEVAALREELAALGESLDQQSAATPEDLAQREEQLRRRRQQLRGRQQQAAGELADARQDAREADDLELTAPQTRRRRRLEEQRDELREQASRDEQDQRTIYELPGGSVEFGWIVVIDGGGIRVARVGQSAPPKQLGGASSFLSWASGREDEYILLLAKPSGVDDFDTIQRRFDASDRLFGYDLVAEDETVLDPEKGAGR